MADVPKVLSPEDVVENYPRLTKSTGVLANWRNKKVGPKFYKINNRRVVYKPEDIEAFLFQNPVMTIDSAR